MKASEILSFVAGAAAAAGITLLFTTDKGKDIREKVASRMTKEEIDKVIEKLKNYRKAAPSEEDSVVDEIFEDEGSQEMED
ncbi:MAG: YtxH domain-containing protein [Bacteroidales bacterium]|nr:YtxH domain-containing protein [Bacteroidales bacterium]